nr:unnamed protein product [Callosobruchus analis]
MFVHSSGLTYSQTSLIVCMAQPPIGTSGGQLKQFSLVQKSIASLIIVSLLSIKGATNDKSFRNISSSIRR